MNQTNISQQCRPECTAIMLDLPELDVVVQRCWRPFHGLLGKTQIIQFFLVLLFYVFPIGETSAGKSSLINLLLNDEVMPTGVLQNTLTICEISYGPRKEALIHFDKPEGVPIRIKEREFDRIKQFIQQPVDGERRCEKIEIKIKNELLKVETLFLRN